MWLDDALKGMTLTEDVEGYLLGRGAKGTMIEAEGIKTWSATDFDIPDPVFVKTYGIRGEHLNGYLVVPVRSPRGLLIGFEARNTRKKEIQDYRLPETKWTPFFLGTRAAMPAIWAMGDVWICEGLFDKAALEWAVPPKDAVLATVRAKLTDLHVEFLRRFCRGWVYMVYDRDQTGVRATGIPSIVDNALGVLDKRKQIIKGWKDPESGKIRYGALAVLNRAMLRCRYVQFQGGKDPGEIWDSGGEKAIRSAIQKAVILT